jgi:intergrase/recombinase
MTQAEMLITKNATTTVIREFKDMQAEIIQQLEEFKAKAPDDKKADCEVLLKRLQEVHKGTVREFQNTQIKCRFVSTFLRDSGIIRKSEVDSFKSRVNELGEIAECL